MTHPVIVEVCKKHGIEPQNFFGTGRTKKLWECRVEAARIFRDRGHSWQGVANLVKRNRDTIRYWLDDGYRQSRSDYILKSWHETYKHKKTPKTHRRASSELRDEIYRVHLDCPKKATELAVSHGFCKGYARRLAWKYRREAAHDHL